VCSALGIRTQQCACRIQAHAAVICEPDCKMGSVANAVNQKTGVKGYMAESAGKWIPPSDVTAHSGDLIPSDSIFFAAPPPEIGQVLSAHSGIRTNGSAITRPSILKVVACFALLGGVTGETIGLGLGHGNISGRLIGAVIGALLFGWAFAKRELGRNECTYVGILGVARFSPNHKGPAQRGQVLLFVDAVDLQTALLGRKHGTHFHYAWRSAQGKVLFKLVGGYYGTQKHIDPDAVFHFARAAEEAWSGYLLPKVLEDIRQSGSYHSQTRRGLIANQHLVVGPGFLDLVTDGKTIHSAANDIADIVVDRGWIIIRRKDAQDRQINSFDGSHGIIRLSYGCVGNVRVVLTLMSEVVGVKWQNAAEVIW